MGKKIASEVDEKMHERERRRESLRVKQAMFPPPTWAVFGCKFEVQSEVQLEVDSEHAKRYVLDFNLYREIDEKIHRFWW